MLKCCQPRREGGCLQGGHFVAVKSVVQNVTEPCLFTGLAAGGEILTCTGHLAALTAEHCAAQQQARCGCHCNTSETVTIPNGSTPERVNPPLVAKISALTLLCYGHAGLQPSAQSRLCQCCVQGCLQPFSQTSTEPALLWAPPEAEG